MNREVFENLKVGDKVVIGGHSKFKGQIATVVKVQNNQENPTYNRLVIIHNDIIGERRYHFKILQLEGYVKPLKVVPSKLEIYRFDVQTNYGIKMCASVISNNQVDAHDFIYNDLLPKFELDDFTIRLRDIVPITNGIII